MPTRIAAVVTAGVQTNAVCAAISSWRETRRDLEGRACRDHHTITFVAEPAAPALTTIVTTEGKSAALQRLAAQLLRAISRPGPERISSASPRLWTAIAR